jgi:hypothetical protein
MGYLVTQIVALRQVDGKSEALVQWACSWNKVEQLAGQAVAQVLDTRMHDGSFEVLVQWCCTWADVDDELMSGDLWQAYLDNVAIMEANEKDGLEEEARPLAEIVIGGAKQKVGRPRQEGKRKVGRPPKNPKA